MKGKCPSCGAIGDYKSMVDVCISCKRGVKLIRVEEEAPEKKVRVIKKEEASE